jgi:hypothetical protein
MEIVAETRQKHRERLYREGGDDKRNTKAERVDCEQARAFAYRLLGRGNGQDRGQDRADAWRPAECERETNQIGPPKSDRLCDFKSLLPMQQGDWCNAEEVQTHNDNDNAGNRCQGSRIGADERADDAGASTECDKHRGEPQDKQRRGNDRVAFYLGFCFLIRKTFERGACHKHKIRRHKRQHTRGKKTDETRNQSSQESDFAIHGATRCDAMRLLASPYRRFAET